jgi:RNA polymerase primary sigma factor
MAQLLPRSADGQQRRFHNGSDQLDSLLSAEISFVMNDSFVDKDDELEAEIRRQPEAWEGTVAEVPRNLPSHLARLCETRILKAEEEQSLFRRMNYWKYRADHVRSTLDPDDPKWSDVELAAAYLAAAEKVRNRVIRANMRLVMSVVKRFVTGVHSFDDLLSDGIYSLMQAVDKFDYARGFRFSTYAYRAIARNTYRKISKQQNELVRFSSDAMETSSADLADASASPAEEVAQTRRRSALTQLVARLDRREQLIVRCRYALGAHRKVKTFQAIADKLGVSKERVRQIEQRAINKLRAMASEMGLDDLVGSSLP